MTPERIREVAEMARKATPGPWAWNEVPLPGVSPTAVAVLLETVPRTRAIVRHEASTWTPTNDDRAFIAALDPATVLALCSLALAAMEDRTSLRAELAELKAERDAWIRERATRVHARWITEGGSNAS